MLVLWITGLAFIGSGLAALVFGVPDLGTPFGSSLFAGGLMFVASGCVISALGLVTRQLGRLREALEAAVGRAVADTAETVPVIATATLQRPLPTRPGETKGNANRDVQATVGDIAPPEKDKERTGAGRSSRASLFPPLVRTARPANAASKAPAIVHAGTVNNLTYELRADGTIIAMLPDRKLEFASIDALRDYLAARPRGGADARSA